MPRQIAPRLSLLLATLMSAPAFAQALPQTEPLVVTASRLAEARTDVLAAMDVIDRREIEASGTQDIVELLRRVAGMDVVRSGGLGQQTSVFLRGSNSNHTLVLVDGVRVSSLGTGAYSWEFLPLAQIERIEIVRGPRAAVWGSDALGGVVQIFTRRDDAPYANLHIGNHDTYGMESGTGWRGHDGGLGIYAGYLQTRGQNATRPGNFTFDPDRDGAVLRNVSVQGDMRLASQQLNMLLMHGDNDVDFDQGESSVRQDVHAISLSGALAAGWHHRLSIGGHRDRLNTPAFFSAYRSRRQQADWQHVFAHSDHAQTSVGLTWLDERGSQIDTFGDLVDYAQSRHTRSAFVGYKHNHDHHAMELAGRYDDNSVYGGKSSFSAAWGIPIGERTRLSAQWGQGFRAPTMNELFSPGYDGWYAGNPALKPERSENVELALQWFPDAAQSVDARLFRNDIDQLIDFAGPLAGALNIDRARIRGAELAWKRVSGPWRIETNATWQDPRNRHDNTRLLRRPGRKATAMIERHFAQDLRFGIEAVAMSSRPDIGGIRLGGHGLLAVRASVPLSRNWAMDARLENLLNRDYTLADGYTTPGTTGLITLRWRQP